MSEPSNNPNKINLDRTEDTINKSVLLNWLYSADKEVPIEELGRWISARTNGKYALVSKDKDVNVNQDVELTKPHE
jgi:hypothetical protein